MRIPLLMDHHNHFFIYSLLADSLNIQSIKDKGRAIELIEKKRERNVGVVLGWNDGYFRFSEKELDAMPPVVICNLSLHGFLVNAAARERLREKDPELIQNIDDSAWRERNLNRILGFLASLRDIDESKITSFADTLAQKGIWACHDMYVSDAGFLEILGDSGLGERVYPWTDLSNYGIWPPRLRTCIRGIKIFTDGALGSRTAALKVPYRDGSRGMLNYSPAKLKEMIDKALGMCDSVAVHAIGDRAIDQVLDNIPEGISGRDGKVIRMEHCQFISRENGFRAREKGMVLCMQPNFSIDSSVYQDRLPEGYSRFNNPFRMLIDEAGFVPGVDLFFGSDGMPHGIESGLQQALFPVYTHQRLTLDEFVAGYCWKNADPGYIDVEIDRYRQEVRAKVILDSQ